MAELLVIIATAVVLAAHLPIVLRLMLRHNSADFSLSAQTGFFAVMLMILPFALSTGVPVFMFLSLITAALSAFVLILIIFYRREPEEVPLMGMLSAERTDIGEVGEKEIAGLSRTIHSSIDLRIKKSRPEDESDFVSLEELFTRPDSEFNLAQAALVMAREDNPRLNIKKYMQKINRLADELNKEIGSKRDHEDLIVRVLNRFVFQEKTFTALSEGPRRAGLRALHLSDVINRRQGHCLSLSVFYLVLAEKTYLPLHGVSVPGHFFVRYETDSFRQNIETTSGGKNFSDRYYTEKYNISRDAISRGVYLTNLNKREVIVEMLNNRANYYYKNGEIDRAMRDFQRATSASFSLAAGYGGLGFIHLDRGDFDKAIRHYKEAVAIDPGYTIAYLSLGEAYLRQGELAEAAANFRKAIESDPGFSQAYTDLGRVFQKQGNLAEARACHLKALKLDNRNTSAFNNLGIVLHKDGKLEAAVDTFREVLRIDRGFIIARENLAKSLIAAYRSTEAEKEIKRVIKTYMKLLKKNPSNHVFQEGLNRFLSEIGHPQAKQGSLRSI